MRNLIKQPSFEGAITDWSATGSTFSVVTGGYVGTKEGQIVAPGSTTPTLATSVAAKPLTQYTFNIYLKGNTPGGLVKVEYYNGASLIGNASGDTFTNLATYTRKGITFTTPANTTSVKAIVAGSVTWATGTTLKADAAMFVAGSETEYFDGDTPGYAWDDTAHNSTSSSVEIVVPGKHLKLEVETAPGTWTDITGPTTTLSVNFEDANAGSLGAEVLDATLDPLISSSLRRGKAVRVKGYDVRSDSFEDVYTGTIDSLNVKRNPRDAHKVSINLTATNNVTFLQGQTEARGVATINELRWLVTGVPFNINGNTTALGTGTIVSKNESASIWDNVLVTRDSALGYAWVDKSNVLQVWDAGSIDTAIKAVIGPDVYAELNADWDATQIINSVSINFMRYDIGTETASAKPYGPYTDDTSIAEWGAYSQTFTLQAAVEDAVAIAAYAQDVLDRNSTAEFRPQTANINFYTTHDLRLAHRLDLNSRVTVTFEDNTTQMDMRVVGVKHAISPDGWSAEYAFAKVDGVANASTPPTSPSAYVPDGSIGEGQLDPDVVASIQSAADMAADALAAADAAADFAATKNAVYRQTTVPTGGTYVTGDIWFDTDDGNKIYVYNGTAFVVATTSHLQTPNGRLTISPTGLTGVNSVGTLMVSLDAGTGALYTVGPIISGGDISGATVTGGTVQSTSTASRGIKLNSTNFIAYDSVGTPTFSITASTGAVAMKGSLTSGSTITGASVVGSSFSTATSGARIELGANYGIAQNEIAFFTSDNNYHGAITANSVGGKQTMILAPGSPPGMTNRPLLALTAYTTGTTEIDLQTNLVTTNGAVVISGADGSGKGLDVTGGGIGTSGAIAAGGRIYSFNNVVGQKLVSEAPASTPSAANVYINSIGELAKSTSSLRYKDVIGSTGLSASTVLALDDIAFTQKDSDDERTWFGFAAEQAHSLGLTQFVDYDADGQPDGFGYGPFAAVGHQVVLRAHEAELADLRAEVADLRALLTP